jgi:hypothetical protein
MKEAEDPNEEVKKIFQERMRTSKCFATDGSKMDNKQLAGFASIDISDGISRKFRISKITSTFTAEALANGETLEIIEKSRLGAKFRDILGLGKRAKVISNASAMKNTAHYSNA